MTKMAVALGIIFFGHIATLKRFEGLLLVSKF